jgi:Domain of unknown function (DUF1906)
MGFRIIQAGEVGADYVKLTDPIKDVLLARKVTFVCRYCVPPETTRIGKAITKDEIAWLHANDIAILLNWEISENEPDRGETGGHRAGKWLRAKAAEYGVPEEVPLFISVDRDTNKFNIAITEQFVRGFDAEIGPHPLGVYGDDDIAYRVRDLNPVFWRANAIGWDGQPLPTPVSVQQYLPSQNIDLNKCLALFPGWTKEQEPIMSSDFNVRIHDTRNGNDIPAGGYTVVQVPSSRPKWAKSVIVNITADRATGPGFLTAYPVGGDAPATSNVNYVGSEPRSNLALVAFDADGRFVVVPHVHSCHVAVDLQGYGT